MSRQLSTKSPLLVGGLVTLLRWSEAPGRPVLEASDDIAHRLGLEPRSDGHWAVRLDDLLVEQDREWVSRMLAEHDASTGEALELDALREHAAHPLAVLFDE